MTTDGDQAMPKRACKWPGGCHRGSFREVDTAAIGAAGRRWLYLHHAGAVWNARKRANRAAGLCPCGAASSPGYRTCEACRERAREDRATARAVNACAAECAITLPRQAGPRRSFIEAYTEAWQRAQRKGRRRWFQAAHGGIVPRPVLVAVSVPWEGGYVTVQAHIGSGSDVWFKGVPVGPEYRLE